MTSFDHKAKVGRILYDKKTGEYVAKRIFTCRAVYEFQGLNLKCQLHGRHKGVHLHGLAKPGAVITITWHPMVTKNHVKVNGKKAAGKRKTSTVLKGLELEMNHGLLELEA